MIKKLVLKGLLLTVMVSTVGCSTFMWEGRAIHQYQKKVSRSDHSFLHDYDIIYVSIRKQNVLNFFSTQHDVKWLSKHTCEVFNNSDIPKNLIDQQLITTWPKCVYEKPDSMQGVLSIHLDQHLKFFKDEVSITYKDLDTSKIQDQVNGIVMIGLDDFSDFLVGDIANRLLMANTPEKGTKAYKQWAKKVKSSCNCLYK